MTKAETRHLTPEQAAGLEKLFRAAWEAGLASKENPVAEISPEENGPADPPTDASDHKPQRKKPGD